LSLIEGGGLEEEKVRSRRLLGYPDPPTLVARYREPWDIAFNT